MISRVTENMKFNAIVGNMANLQNRTQDILEQVASQKKINRPSDDPRGITNALGLRAVNAFIDQYKGNIAYGQDWLNVTDVNLKGVNDLVSQARQVAIQSEGATASDMTIAANQVQSIIDQMLSLANAKLGDQYIFSGTMTDKEPFASSNGPYQGDSQTLLINIGQNSSTGYNVAGDAVFTAAGGVDIFQTLSDLKTGLLNNDSNLVAAAETGLESAGQQVQVGIAKTGTLLTRLAFADSHLTDMAKRIGDMISRTEDADIDQLAVDFQMKQLALNASYSVAAKMNENTILNFLK